MTTPRLPPREHGRIRRPSPLSECGSAVTLTDNLGRELPALERLALRHATRAAIRLSRQPVYPILIRLTNLQQIPSESTGYPCWHER